jgi:hypothetical protein
MRHKHRHRSLALVVAVALLVTGCAAPGAAPATGGSALDRANANFGSTVATGAVAGAALGAVAGALLGGRNRLAGAAIGAAAGGALGTGAGYLVARNNSNQAGTEDTLQQKIAAARQDADYASAAAAEARQRAAEARAASARLAQQYRAGQITAAQYRDQMQASSTEAQKMQKLIGNIDNKTAELRQQAASAGPGGTALRASATSLDSSKRDLQRSLNEITAATSAVPQV